MATKVKVSVRHTKKNGGIDGLRSLLTDKAVKVGVLRGTGVHPNSDTGMSIAQVLAINEFGTDTIPERSVIRFTLRNNRKRYRSALNKLFKRVLDGKITDRTAIAAFGELVQTDVQKRITNIRMPANAPSTIARKGSSNPLIDTGATRQSIRWGIVDASILRKRVKSR